MSWLMTIIEIMEEKMIHSLLERLKDVNSILGTSTDGTMSFEQAYVIARYYYDYQDTNILIDEAERMASDYKTARIWQSLNFI